MFHAQGALSEEELRSELEALRDGGYGGGGEASAPGLPETVERRVDMDGGAYMREEFVALYGGCEEWDESPPEGSGRRRQRKGERAVDKAKAHKAPCPPPARPPTPSAGFRVRFLGKCTNHPGCSEGDSCPYRHEGDERVQEEAQRRRWAAARGAAPPPETPGAAGGRHRGAGGDEVRGGDGAGEGAAAGAGAGHKRGREPAFRTGQLVRLRDPGRLLETG
eukprot:gene381-13460_t